MAAGRQQRSRAGRGRRAAAGFTVIEVLIAVAVTAFGFAAIFSLQISSMQGNVSARETAAAVNLAERYAEALRREAFAWAGPQLPAPLLNRAPGQWHSFSDLPLDHNGRAHESRDPVFGTVLARQRFCVHYWVDRLPDGRFAGALNARVRVVWPRASLDQEPLEEICPEADANAAEIDPLTFFSVTVPVTLRFNGDAG